MKLDNTTAEHSYDYFWLLSRIQPYIVKHWFRILVGFVVAIPVGMLDGIVAFALKPYMDYVVAQKDFVFTAMTWHGITIPSFTLSCAMMAFAIPYAVILFAVIQGILRYINAYLTDWTSQMITNAVKIDLYKKLLSLDARFFDENSSGIILSRFGNDPDVASRGIVEQLKVIVLSLFSALSLIAVMLYSSWKLALIGVIVLGFSFVPVALIRNRLKNASNDTLVVAGHIVTNFNETYTGNKVMRASNSQCRQELAFKMAIKKAFNIGMSLTKRVAWMSPLMYLVASFGIAFVLWFGTKLILDGEMTAGSLASFVTSLLLLYKPVKSLGGTLTGIQLLFVSLGRVFELFDLESEIKEAPDAIDVPELKEGITFENVNFEYVEGHPVLKNINLTIKKGETLAIVGNSGGGKSTIANLLPRFYDVKSGSVKLDGVDIRNFKLKSLRDNIAMVFQNNYLFGTSMYENILLGLGEELFTGKNNVEKLNRAIDLAHLQEVIDTLPDGVASFIAEGGNSLSGGQRQRVGIARALVKDSPIIILDEATSALDNKSEAVVQSALDNLMKDKTVILIAHRFSTIRNADRIAVVNEGEIAELGTHEELMAIENGLYKSLYEMQFRPEDISD